VNSREEGVGRHFGQVFAFLFQNKSCKLQAVSRGKKGEPRFKIYNFTLKI
jgi:hypothetical protein